MAKFVSPRRARRFTFSGLALVVLLAANLPFTLPLRDLTPPVFTGASSLPPVGMLVFCQTYPAQCRVNTVASAVLNDTLKQTLQAVNTRVNRAIVPRNDVGRDVWSMNVTSGDCEDYALTKRAALINIGVPAGALRMAVTTFKGEGHAILVVKTNHGDLVLDNLTPKVRTLANAGYRIEMMSSANPNVWTSLPTHVETSAAN